MKIRRAHLHPLSPATRSIWQLDNGGGRARWKIENETFNTLKNQGYQFEHNFGHGKQNLSVVFALLMMLAFPVDQTQQLCCPLFRAVDSVNVRGSTGAKLTLDASFHAGRKHLPVVTLKRVA